MNKNRNRKYKLTHRELRYIFKAKKANSIKQFTNPEE